MRCTHLQTFEQDSEGSGLQCLPGCASGSGVLETYIAEMDGLLI